MRREGRQHGMVITHIVISPPFNSNPKSRILNKLEAPVIAGVYAKVSSKPTNHSKFTGRCSKTMCSARHLRPACKSKAKAKGHRKFRSLDFSGVLDYHDHDHHDDNDDIDDDDGMIGGEGDHKGGDDDDHKEWFFVGKI
ncbi:uncharacterized protein LOC120262193 [Dioscorea cayenensis subsp. rotundata]|uniref:Uncharacterized protein LOC120262193 n=1 Tax=Dioscorea cayennensis subsp. rotundata TaxID=55577 RepID=A0AB40BGH7_DIOCR|nr:uncharacterized protein LOC120262193 [Dioscorea cayenensis subsp. rotundata]